MCEHLQNCFVNQILNNNCWCVSTVKPLSACTGRKPPDAEGRTFLRKKQICECLGPFLSVLFYISLSDTRHANYTKHRGFLWVTLEERQQTSSWGEMLLHGEVLYLINNHKRETGTHLKQHDRKAGMNLHSPWTLQDIFPIFKLPKQSMALQKLNLN